MIPEEYSYPHDRFVLVGKIKKAHGLSGEVGVFVFSGETEGFGKFSKIVLVDEQGRLSQPLTLKQCRVHGRDSVLVRFDEITTRTAAENIHGAGVLVEQDALPELEEGEYYWFQLYGKKVVDVENTVLGDVVSVFHNGAQDVLVVKKDERSEEILIPISRETLLAEVEDKLIVELPPGLVDLNKGID